MLCCSYENTKNMLILFHTSESISMPAEVNTQTEQNICSEPLTKTFMVCVTRLFAAQH
jgi:hypothetical protein